MCNQNIISNKFDLKLVTANFTKSRSLHYILKKQRKSKKSERNDAEERNDAFLSKHTEEKRRQRKE